MKMPFTLSQLRPIREAMTVSRPAKLGESVPVTWFSLGGGTSITPEYYDCTVRGRLRHISSGWREPYCPAASRPAAGRSA